MVVSGQGYNAAYGVSIVVVAVLGLFAFMASITFSRSGWRVDDSDPEWIAASRISSLSALFYLTSKEKRKDEQETIVPDQRQRNDRF
jgi:hypothetical protein